MAAQDSTRVTLHWGMRITMRDGIRLNATLYTPKEQSAPSPCILALTPYISDHLHERACYFSANGLPFVAVDVRGRGNSDGIFRPYIQEAEDGYDLVQWIARQDYCNGKVAMYGGSYLGHAQWAAAKGIPAALATIVPAAAPYLGVDVPMRNNIVYPFIAQWLTFVSGHTSQAKIFSDRAFWSEGFREWHDSGRSFRDLDTLLGNPSPILQEWLGHPEPDEYWDAHNPTADQYAALQLPILTITGSYDDDQPGALEHYQRHMSSASPEARSRHYLVIGPWDHASTGTPKPEFGGLTYGADSLLDLPKLHREWYAWTMQGGRKPEFLKKPVAYYVMGRERWRYADTLEGVTAKYMTYFLDSTHNPNDVFCAGSLRDIPGSGKPDTYTYDPSGRYGPEIDAETHVAGGSLVDQSVMLALGAKKMVYHSAPFEQDTEVSGFFKLSLWLSLDCPDADIYVSVHEIELNGRSIRLSTDALRARYRAGLRTPELIRGPKPRRHDFVRFTFVSRLIKQGHRLRLVVAPMGRLIEATFVQKNYAAGGVVAEETAENAEVVTVTLLHDESHPSALCVPLAQVENTDEPMAPHLSLMDFQNATP